MLDISEVKKAAVQHIKDSLTPDNVIPEIFSVFASKYDEIYKAELEYVKTRWVSILSISKLLISIFDATKAEIRSSSYFKESVCDLFTRRQGPHIAKIWLDIIEATSS